MEMKKVQIASAGIKRALKKYDYCTALAEYIWNAFDAKATEIDIQIENTEIGSITSLKVIDNGNGIVYPEKFEPVFESDKVIDPDAPRQSSELRGKNGFGRLTFFKFAESAKWETFVAENGVFYTYSIEIHADQLDGYAPSEKVETSLRKTGTVVSFGQVHTITIQNFETDIKSHLCRAFAWFLELNANRKLSIKINGVNLGYQGFLIADQESKAHEIDDVSFEIQYIRWRESLAGEYSRYYLIDENGQEKYTSTTTLNKKSDKFHHSVFIKSSLFDSSDVHLYDSPIFRDTPKGKTYRELFKFLEHFLREKRREFIRTVADELINDFEKQGVFPRFGNQLWDRHRKNELESIVKDLFRVEPKIFTHLSKEQKKIFVRFLDAILEDGEREKIFEIINEVISLHPQDLEQLASSLKTSSLSNIIKTIQLLEDRYILVKQLKALVFNKNLNANERDHLQKLVAQHYWIFGEEYTLITAEEPDFEEALRRHTYLLRGDNAKKKIAHSDKNKEMDIFMVRQILKPGIGKVEHVVIELKHPKINLGEKELSQVKKYMKVILAQDEFNAPNMTWTFYLVGNDFDNTGFIEGELENAKQHGESSLVSSIQNYKIYVKKWSEIFTEFELKHEFLYKKLSLERDKMVIAVDTTEAILKSANKSSAKQSPEIQVPSPKTKTRAKKAQ